MTETQGDVPKRQRDRPKPGKGRRFNSKWNNWLDAHQRLWWWFVFVVACAVCAAVTNAVEHFPGVTSKGVNIVGAAVVAVGLAAQAADGLKDRKERAHTRPSINVFGFLIAAGGASIVLAGQMMS